MFDAKCNICGLVNCCPYVQVLPSLPVHRDAPFQTFQPVDAPQFSVDFITLEPLELQVRFTVSCSARQQYALSLGPSIDSPHCTTLFHQF